MDEAERRDVHDLIAKAAEGDKAAALTLEDCVLAWEAAQRTDAIAYVMDRLSLLGVKELRERILARLTHDRAAHPDDRPPWIA
jgi:hypothetical protein